MDAILKKILRLSIPAEEELVVMVMGHGLE
jgi:hypothetical protein